MALERALVIGLKNKITWEELEPWPELELGKSKRWCSSRWYGSEGEVRRELRHGKWLVGGFVVSDGKAVDAVPLVCGEARCGALSAKDVAQVAPATRARQLDLRPAAAAVAVAASPPLLCGAPSAPPPPRPRRRMATTAAAELERV